MATVEAPDTATKRRVRVTMTKRMWVDIDADEAEMVLPVLDEDGKVVHRADITDLSDHVTRWQRIAHHGTQFCDGDLEVEDATDETPWAPDAVDGSGREQYLWSARHFVNKARFELSCGRYREGKCPELDAVNGALARLEDELRLMALEIDRPDMAEVKAWRDAKVAAAERAGKGR